MSTSREAQNLIEKISYMADKQLSFENLIVKIISEICQYNNWHYGEVWLPDNEKKQLIFAANWNSNKTLFEEFRKFSSICKFAKGIGLVGKVWEKEGVLLDKELSIKTDFQRYDIARHTGIVSGIGIFVRINDDLPCVFTFFLIKNTPDDDKKIKIVSEIAADIGKLLNQNINKI